MRYTTLLLLVSSIWARGQENDFSFEDKSEGVSFKLPADWTAFPKESLFRVAGFGAKLEPTPPARELVAVFQRGSDLDHPGFPRIVVHACKSDLNEQRFRTMHSAPLFEIDTAQSLGFSGRPQFMKSAHYNSVRQCLEFNFECYVEDAGFVRAAGRTFLTDKGVVSVYGYALGNDFDAFEREFDSIVSTLRIAPEHRYKPRTAATPAIPTPAETRFGFHGIVFLGIGLMALGRLFISRRESTVWSDEV